VLCKEGVAAAEAGQTDLAHEKLKAAWSLRQTYDIAASLGFVENALGRHRDAAEHIDYALKNFAPVGDAGARTELLAVLDRARKKIGQLKITSLRSANIEVNGAVIGTAPLVATVFVDAEKQIVTAKMADVGKGKVLVDVRIGESREVRVDLVVDPSSEEVKGAPAAALARLVGGRPRPGGGRSRDRAGNFRRRGGNRGWRAHRSIAFAQRLPGLAARGLLPRHSEQARVS